MSILAFLIKALSLSLNEYPHLNSVVDPKTDSEGFNKQYIIKADHNFSIAIDSKSGLTRPNIKKL